MTYCSIADMVTRYNRYQDLKNLCKSDDNPDGDFPNPFIIEAIKAATGECDSALSAHYALPLKEIPQIIVDIACTIAFGLMNEWRQVGDKDHNQYIAMQQARATLSQIQQGKMKLDLPSLANANNAEIEINSSGRRFDRNSWKGL